MCSGIGNPLENLFGRPSTAGSDAQRAEFDRQRRINSATAAINAIFDNQVKKGTRLVKNPAYTAAPGVSDLEKFDRQLPGASVLGGGGRSGLFADNFGGGGLFGSRSEIASQPEYIEEDYYVPGDPANDRARLYDRQRQAVLDLNNAELERQKALALRSNKFNLARAGLMGSSVDVDSNAELGRLYQKGILDATTLGDQAASDLRTADEKARSNLLTMAQSGLETGVAAQQALNALSQNASNAEIAGRGRTLGDVFSDLSRMYQYNQQQAGLNAAIQNAQRNQNYGVSSTRDYYSGS